ncbi:MAG TPA: PilZ domain-containing protein, partial [Methylomicrobium sp.]|nr:PilZ domain-containing protein [Methylomicrobium sp.]
HLIPGLEFPVTFRLGSKDGSLSTFDFQARVVRAHNDMFAVQFIDLDEAQKAQLYDSLAYELNNSV